MQATRGRPTFRPPPAVRPGPPLLSRASLTVEGDGIHDLSALSQLCGLFYLSSCGIASNMAEGAGHT